MSITWHIAIRDFVTYLRAAGRPNSTIRLRRQQLHQLMEATGTDSPWEVTTDGILTWFGEQTWARDTRHSVRSGVRTFYAWAVESGHLEESPGDRLPTISRRAPRPKPTPDVVYQAALADVAPARASRNPTQRRGWPSPW